MRRITSFSLLIFATLLFSSCEEKGENLSNLKINNQYDSLFRVKINNNPKQAIKIAKEQYQVGHDRNNDVLKGSALNNLGLVFEREGEIDTARIMYSKALQHFEKAKYTTGKIRSMNNIAMLNTHLGEYKVAQNILWDALQLSIKTDDKKSKAMLTGNLGYLYENMSLYDSAGYYYLKSIQHSQAINDSLKEANAWGNLAVIMKNKGSYDSTISYIHKSLSLRASLDDKLGMAIDQHTLAQVYQHLGYFEKAEENFLSALAIGNELEHQMLISVAGGNYANLLEKNQKFEEAKSIILNNVLPIDESMNNSTGVAHSYNSLGKLESELGNFSNAINYHKRALNIYKEAGKRSGIEDVFTSMGVTLSTYGKYELSNEYLDSAIIIGLEIQDYPSLPLMYKTKAQNQYFLKDYKNALEMELQYAIYNDTIYNREKLKVVNELQIKYETEKKKLENTLLKASLIEEKLVNEQQRLKIIGTSIGMVLLASLLGLYVRSFKKEKKLRKRIEILNREVHHRVKNNLAIIKRLISISINDQDPDSVRKSEELLSRVESISLLHDILCAQDNTDQVDLKLYLEKLCNCIQDIIQSPKIKLHINSDSNLLIKADPAYPIGLITNEIVTNSFKHGFPNVEEGNIHISVKKEKEYLMINYRDDGLGISENFNIKSSNSYGMKLIKGLSEQLKGHIKLEPSENGTFFSLKIPLYEKEENINR